MTDIYKEMEALVEDARGSGECGHDFCSAMTDLIRKAREDNAVFADKVLRGYLSALGEMGALALQKNKLFECIGKVDNCLMLIADWHHDNLTNFSAGYECDEFGGERWEVESKGASELDSLITDAQNAIPPCVGKA